ncbi:hypothetical protein GE061_009431 [Apolygus lucorum]|uniref:Uncharacterized protein n=1 Tax=Apolygus lucorum TaxID=248454 RepID=A0A8S9Y288_APOLU|nr:hypothetical protein GE061_009431 [Apolygus lucorum]
MLLILRGPTLFNMNSIVTVLVMLSLLAKSNAAPLGSGMDAIALLPLGLNGFYNQEVVLVNLPIKYGFGYNKNGAYTAGFRVECKKFSNKPWTFTVVLRGNPHDLKNTFAFEIGTLVMDGLGGVLFGDKNGLKWMSSLWVPVRDGVKGLHAVGMSLQGEKWNPVAVTGGVSIDSGVYEGKLTLDENSRPFGASIVVGGQPNQLSFLTQKKLSLRAH